MSPETKANLLYFLCGIALGILGIASLLAFLFGARGAVYDTTAEAVADGAFERGWIPAFVPLEARELREVHDVSEGWTWGSFKMPTTSRDWLNALQPAPPREPIWLERPPLRAKLWWPRALSGKVTPPQVRQLGFDVLVAEESTKFGSRRVYVFVDPRSDSVYFHRTR